MLYLVLMQRCANFQTISFARFTCIYWSIRIQHTFFFTGAFHRIFLIEAMILSSECMAWIPVELVAAAITVCLHNWSCLIFIVTPVDLWCVNDTTWYRNHPKSLRKCSAPVFINKTKLSTFVSFYHTLAGVWVGFSGSCLMSSIPHELIQLQIQQEPWPLPSAISP